MFLPAGLNPEIPAAIVPEATGAAASAATAGTIAATTVPTWALVAGGLAGAGAIGAAVSGGSDKKDNPPDTTAQLSLRVVLLIKRWQNHYWQVKLVVP